MKGAAAEGLAGLGLLVAAVSVGEVGAEDEATEEVEEGPGEAGRGGEAVRAAQPVHLQGEGLNIH